MECNKDEAIRAKQIAERKMENSDFVGALKFAKKAQNLFPGVEKIVPMLTVCEVHFAAHNKLCGLEMDWYGILQTEIFADDATIRKQYKKLALVLHPDKNNFPGSESAFKLVGEANRLLNDQKKRTVYDIRCRALMRTSVPVSHQSKGDHFFKRDVENAPKCQNSSYRASTNCSFNQQAKNLMFWACCPHCNSRYEYHRSFINAFVRCQACFRYFAACDLEAQGGPKSSHKTDVSKDGSKKVGSQSKGERKRDCKVSKRSSDYVNKKSGKRRTSGDDRSAKEPVSDDKHFENPRKKPRGSGSSNAEDVAVDGARTSSQLPKERHSDTSAGDLSGKKEGTQSSSKESFNPESIEYPDSEFFDFMKDRSQDSFCVDQIWALYDSKDGMPRYYARIQKVMSPGFRLSITWLEPNPQDQGEIDWCDRGLPVACGDFKLGDTEETGDLLMFSHQVLYEKCGRRRYMIYPRKGETWAIFRNWDITWSCPEKHEYDFEYVEVISDLVKDVGIEVSYLGKVKGFVSLFQQIKQTGDQSFRLPPNELYRFSHQIPSFRMTGHERVGVPKGSFEFDPAALPVNLSYISEKPDDKNNKTDNGVRVSFKFSEGKWRKFTCEENLQSKVVPESCDAGTNSSVPVDAQREGANNIQAKKCRSTKSENCSENGSHQGFNQPVAKSTSQANELMQTANIRQKTCEKKAFELRRSPRGLCNKNTSVKAS